jgi:putative spermidine/putrescine transport system permease protein
MMPKSPAQRATDRALSVFGVLALIFLSGPLLVIIPMSFSSAGGLQFPPPGWSTQWYEALFTNPRWGEAVRMSLLVGVTSSTVALILGGLAAYGLARGSFRGRGILLGNFLAPMIVPPIVTAVALYLAFSRYGIRGTFFGLALGHIIIVIPYVVLLVAVAVQSFDHRLELMARSLGATWTTALRLVVLPILAPSIAAAWLIAFVMSFDEVIVTIFVAGTTDTVPKLMFSQLRDRIDPTVTALSTLLIVFTIAVVALGALLVRLSTRRGTALGGVVVGAEKAEADLVERSA